MRLPSHTHTFSKSPTPPSNITYTPISLTLPLSPSGIDLASPSELIAHERDRFEIAKHIGAEEVIYQDLDDLKACCAELSPRPDMDFEVGVFCGKYITEVPEGYFAHLDALRGDKRRTVPAVLASQTGNGGPVMQGDAKGVKGCGLQPNGHPEPLRSPADREDIR